MVQLSCKKYSKPESFARAREVLKIETQNKYEENKMHKTVIAINF